MQKKMVRLCGVVIVVLVSVLPVRVVRAGFVFTNFDGPAPNEHGTMISGINNRGVVVGKVMDAGFDETGFVGVPGGQFTPFVLPNGSGSDALITSLGGINDFDAVVGNSAPSVPGRPGDPIQIFQDGTTTLLSLPSDFGGTAARGINNAGTIAGAYNDLILRKPRGFVRDAEGSYTRFDATPTTIFTLVSGINNAGTVLGNYSVFNGFTAGFERTADGTITLLPNPASIGGIAVFNINYNGINDHGVTVGVMQDEPGNFYGFVRDAAGNFTLVRNPINPTGSALIGINNSGMVLGDYLDGRGVEHAYVAVQGGTGDLNCDGLKDGEDVQAFVLAVENPNGFAAGHPGCSILNADFDGDGQVTAADAPGMVNCLLNGFCP